MALLIEHNDIHKSWTVTAIASGVQLVVENNTYIKNGAIVATGRTELLIQHAYGNIGIVQQTPDLPTVPIDAMKEAIKLYEETYGNL